MTPTRTILHPTDFSERSALAFELACSLARDLQARLVVLHVTTPRVFAQGGAIPRPVHLRHEAELWQELHRLRAPDPSVYLEHQLREGDPAAEIVGAARAAGAELIVMGTHGATGLRRLLMGSVAAQVVRDAPCAVVTVALPASDSLAPAGDE